MCFNFSSVKKVEMPLNVYVLYHHNYSEGPLVYEKLYKLLCRDPGMPFDSGIDIPVYLKTDINGTIDGFGDIGSNKILVLILMDQNMFLSDVWKNFINKELKSLEIYQNKSVQIVPVSVYKYAVETSKWLAKYQFISFSNEPILSHEEEFMQRIYDVLIRFLNSDKNGTNTIQQLKIFISHSKRDKDQHGLKLAKDLRDYFLQSGSKLSSFFDVNSIIEGYDFEEQIETNAENSIMIVIFSETYSSREWCIKEILAAKRFERPIVVVFTVKNEIERILPYIGNVPGTYFNGDWTPVVNLLLRTTLNHFHQEKLLKQYATNGESYLHYAPDTYSIYYLYNKGIKADKILYPEPPLASDEKKILEVITRPKIKFVTPLQKRCEGMDLEGRTIALSMSDDIESHDLGVGKVMIDDMIVEIIRSILISKGKIAYSGNIRKDGLTYTINDIALQYSKYKHLNDEEGECPEDEKYATAFIAWPHCLKINDDMRSEFKHCHVTYLAGEPDDSVPNEERECGAIGTDAEIKAKKSASMTKLRKFVETYEFTNSNNHKNKLLARIFIGGKLSGFTGQRSGIEEEFEISCNNKTPIFMLGGFGGMTKQIIERKDFDCDILHNGLSEDDNETLFKSTNIFDIIPTLLRGLNELIKNGR